MAESSYKKYFDLEQIIKDIHKYLPNFDEKPFRKAFEFAEHAHKGQMRVDKTTPYIVHPISVVKNLIKIKADDKMLIAALLHDVPEDTKFTIKEVEENFSSEVAFLVDGITKLKQVNYEHEMTDSKIESLKKLFLHTAKDPRVIIVKLADRLHNMSTLEYKRPDKQVRIAKETLEIYVPAANLLGIYAYKTPLENLCFQYLYPTEFAALNSVLVNHNKLLDKPINDFIIQIRKLLKSNEINAKVFKNYKSLYHVYKQICTLGRPIDVIDDQLIINIQVDDISKCYKILGLIHGDFLPKSDRFKDFIANPKPNGYRSLHTVVFGVKGLQTEIHIFTEKMALEAEYGIAYGLFFKDANDENLNLHSKQSAWINKIVEMEKKEGGREFLENIKSDIFEDRIVVYTTNGSTIDLPEGSTAIDFAYALGSSFGNHASKVIINNHAKFLTTQLKSGDVVSIINDKSKDPEIYWLNFAKTNFAKSRIKKFFSEISDDKKIDSGKRLIQKEFDILGLGVWKDISFKKIERVLPEQVKNKITSWKELFMFVGSGNLRAATVARNFQKRSSNTFKSNFLGKFFKLKTKERISVTMRISAKDRRGLTNDIVVIVDRNAVNMTIFRGWNPRFTKNAYFYIRFFVDSPREIGRIFYEIRQIDGIINVTRVQIKGVLLLYSAILFTFMAWISYNYTLQYILSNSESFNPITLYLLLYLELFLPLLTVLFLISILQKYFPITRNRLLTWISSFVILSLSVVQLSWKFSVLNLDLNPWFFLIGILAAYAYLFKLYINFSKLKSMRKI